MHCSYFIACHASVNILRNYLKTSHALVYILRYYLKAFYAPVYILYCYLKAFDASVYFYAIMLIRSMRRCIFYAIISKCSMRQCIFYAIILKFIFFLIIIHVQWPHASIHIRRKCSIPPLARLRIITIPVITVRKKVMNSWSLDPTSHTRTCTYMCMYIKTI